MGTKGHPFLLGSAALLKTPPPPIGVSGAHILAEAKHQAVPLRGRTRHELDYTLTQKRGKRAPLGNWDTKAMALQMVKANKAYIDPAQAETCKTGVGGANHSAWSDVGRFFVCCFSFHLWLCFETGICLLFKSP